VFWLTDKNKGITTLLILIACLSDILFFITGRMALIGLFASLFLLVYQVNIKNSHKLIFTLLILLVAVSVVTYSQGIQTRLLSIYFECKDFFINANSDTSGGNRLHYWGIACNFIASHPFIGMGAGSFRQFLIDTNDTIALNNHYTHMHSHNEYLTIFSLYGAIGLTIFLLMLRELYTNINLFQSNTVRYSCFMALSLILFNALTDSSINNQWEGWTFVLYASFVSANVLDKCKSESAAP
jgi:O-antigen ligase